MGLAALAGLVDATGFLAADGYFTSFMSGNTTRLAVDIVAEPARAIIPALLILGFFLGVVGGALVADWAGPRRKTALLACVGILLLAAATLQQLAWKEGYLAASVLAMGALNNTFRKSGESSVAVTYMTGAIVRFGQAVAAWISGKPRPDWVDNTVLWLSLLAGGIIGTWLFLMTDFNTHWLSAALVLVLLISARRIEQRDG